MLLIPAAFVIGWWSYRGIEGLSPYYRYSLSALRGSALALLLILLLNPAFTLQQEYRNTGEIAILWDNSASTTIEKGDYEGEQSYNNVWNALDPFESAQVRFHNYGFDTEVRRLEERDDLTLEGEGTDIDNALFQVREELEDEHAVILVSDGIYNTGRNPTGQAGRYPVPIYSVAIGDTTRLDDIIVREVSHSSTAYLNTRTAVTTTVINEGFPDSDLPVQLRQEGEVLEEEIITTRGERSAHEVRFELDMDEEGLQQYEIHVPELEGEWTGENNTQQFAIEVVDDRTRIMLFAFEIHPDVRALRSILGRDESVELDYRTWLGGERFSEGALPNQPDTLDQVVFYGYPHPDLPTSLRGDLQNFAENLPISFFSSSSTDYNRLINDFAGIAPLDGSGGRHENMHPALPAEQSHPILELPELEFTRMPPLRVPQRTLEARSGTQTLMTGSLRGSDTGTPLLAVRTVGNLRASQFTGHGFYRWYLSDDEETREFTIELVNNIIKWTATSADEELLDISPVTHTFQQTDDIILDAYLQNESGEAEPDGMIDVEIDGEPIDASQYTMSNQGLGQYRLDIGRLPEGIYSYEAVAEKDGRVLDEQSGEFSVGSSNIEFMQTERNDELLRYLAEETGGRFLTHLQHDEIRDILQEDELFEQRTEVSQEQFMAYQNPLWFILIVLLLSAEWVIRKVVALP